MNLGPDLSSRWSVEGIARSPAGSTFTIRGIFFSMAPLSVDLKPGQSVVLHSNPKDAAGNPAVPFNGPTYTTDHPELISLTPSTDKLSCTIASLLAQGAPGGGAALVTIHGQAVNFGPDVTATVTVNVLTGGVAAGVLDHYAPTFDTPTP